MGGELFERQILARPAVRRSCEPPACLVAKTRWKPLRLDRGALENDGWGYVVALGVNSFDSRNLCPVIASFDEGVASLPA